MPNTNDNQAPLKGTQFAWHVGIDFVSSIFVGVFFGVAVDHLCSTSPWGLLVFIVLGVCTGFYGIFKLIQQSNSKITLDRVKRERKPND